MLPAGAGPDQLSEPEAQRRLRDVGSRLGQRLQDEDVRRGLLTLGGRLTTSNGTRLRCGEDVTIEFGPMRGTIDGDQFRSILGQCLYIRPFRDHDRTGFNTVVLDLGRGRWTALGRTDSTLTPEVLNRPVTVTLEVGDAAGSMSIRLTRRGVVWVLRD